MDRLPRLPRTVVFSPLFRVRVKQVVDAELKSICEDADAIWTPEDRIIRIRKRLPAAKKWYLLTHELAHALADFQHHLLLEGIAQSA